jgi:hypothetical protein
MSKYMARGSLNYGMQMIGFATLFTGVECSLHYIRAKKESSNTLIAGPISGAIVGPLLGVGAVGILYGAIIGSAIGTAMAGPELLKLYVPGFDRKKPEKVKDYIGTYLLCSIW